MSEVAEEKTVLDDLFFNGSYGHINSIVRHYGNHNVLFTDAGKMRLAHIVGHTLGLHHGGQEETALKLAEAIDARLKQLSTMVPRLKSPLLNTVEATSFTRTA